MRYQLLFICLILFLSNKSISQDLHIHYDFFTDEFKYILDGKEVNKPKIKKGNMVHLHVNEMNNYLYKLDVSATEKKKQGPATGGLNLGSLQELFKNLKPAEEANVNNYKSSEIIVKDFSITEVAIPKEVPGTRGGSAEVANTISAAISNTARNLNQIKSNQKEIQAKVKMIHDLVMSLQILELSETKLSNLKYNPRLKPSSIKNMTMEYTNTLFQLDSSKTINLLDIIEYNKKPDKIFDLKEEVQSLVADNVNATAEVLSFLPLLKEESLEDDEVSEFYSSALRAMTIINENKSSVESFVANVEVSDAEKSVNDLYDLRIMAEEINSNDFTSNFDYMVEDDEMSITVNAKLLNNESATGGEVLVKSQTINVESYGGIKVNASLGISFGNFFDKVESYFVDPESNQIVSSKSDAFFPIVSSFIHFYPNSSKQTIIGGTFGIGFPITSIEEAQSAAFFLGPCLIFGKHERAIVNAGVMGARVRRLSNGKEVGDIIAGNVVPLKSNYEYGFFVGVSFNLTSNN